MKYISLQVCGRPASNGGFCVITSFNEPKFYVEDRIPGGFSGNSYFFTVRTDEQKVVYKLIKNRVKSSGASRVSYLIIAISVPKGYKINGYTPYEALIELKDSFLSSCMECKDAMSESYEFKSGIDYTHVLDNVAGNFALVPAEVPHSPMKGSTIGYVAADEEKIGQLLSDVQYSEFTKYSEIVVAENAGADAGVPLAGSTIPRVPMYSIFKDGQIQTTVGNLDEQITAIGESDSRYYENDKVTFTIRNLKDGDSIGCAVLDNVNERIYIDTTKLAHPKKLTVHLRFMEPKAGEYFLKNRNLLMLKDAGGKEIQLSESLTFEVVGENLKYLYQLGGYTLSSGSGAQYTIRNIFINIATAIMNVTTESVYKYTSRSDNNKSCGTISVSGKKTDACQIVLCFDENGRILERNGFMPRQVEIVRQIRDAGRDVKWETIRTEEAVFRRQEGVRGKFQYVYELYVPASWSDYQLYVRIQSSGKSYISKDSLDVASGREKKLGDSDFEEQKVGFAGKIKQYRVCVMFAAGLILATLLTLLSIGIILTVKEQFFNEDMVVPENVADDARDDETEAVHVDTAEYGSNAAGGIIEGAAAVVSASATDYRCEFCDSSFGSADELEEHIKQRDRHKCFICNDIFCSDELLKTHLKERHPELSTENLKCETCGRTFISRRELKVHKRKMHHFVCPRCGENKWFKTQKELLNHLKTAHNEE